MIYLSPEVASGLGEDTFWTWFKREFPDSEWYNNQVPGPEDVILRYSTMGGTPHYESTICLLWELYPEMKQMLGVSDYDFRLPVIEDCARRSKYKVVASSIMIPYYEQSHGQIDVLPIGINSSLFKDQPENKIKIRKKYKINPNAKICFWGGTTHPMKGYDILSKFREDNKDTEFIVVWKSKEYLINQIERTYQFAGVSQDVLAELMACSDFTVSTSRLRPYYMIEWEAMMSNLPLVNLTTLQKDFTPKANPRQQVKDLFWDREDAKVVWRNYINKVIQNKKS